MDYQDKDLMAGTSTYRLVRIRDFSSCSTLLSMKFIRLINVKMPTMILTFISRIILNNYIDSGCFDIYEQFDFYAQLS